MDGYMQGLSDRFGSRMIATEAALAQYALSEGHHCHAPPSAVVQPVTIEEVQYLVSQAAQTATPIVAYGAGTSLEGNAASVEAGSLCIDFSRMNRVVDVSAEDLLCVVEPGVTREQLNSEMRATGVFFPVDPGANASLGGMIATRASGTTTVRYGSMRDNVLGLKVVTADGSLITTGTRARKSACRRAESAGTGGASPGGSAPPRRSERPPSTRSPSRTGSRRRAPAGPRRR